MMGFQVRSLQLRPARIAAVVLPALLNGVTSAVATCYYPDGTISGDHPCSPTGTTHCCGANSGVCLSNGYCIEVQAQPYILSRASCTDKNWGPGCPTNCIGSNDNPSGGIPITWIKTDSSGANQYCCGPLAVDNHTVSCANGESSFTLGPAKLVFGAAILTNATASAGSASPTMSSSSFTTSPTSPSTTTSSSSSTTSGNTRSSGTAGGSSSSGSSSDGSGDGSRSGFSSSETVAVGIGLAVPLGLAAIASIGWAMWERRKRKREVQMLMGTLNVGSGAPSSFSPGISTTVPSPYNASTKYPSGGNVPVELSTFPEQIGELPPHQQGGY